MLRFDEAVSTVMNPAPGEAEWGGRREGVVVYALDTCR